MNTQANVIYESWNLDGPSIPARSTLYNLEPIGIGTGLVECLTSYVSRLAAAHCMSPAVLLARALVPIIGKEYWLRGKTSSSTRSSILGNSFSLPAKVVNGQGLIAKDWVAALQGLTLREDLSFLTMLPWAAVFPQRKLLRSTKAWCASCYAEWRANNQIIYEPLLWTLLSVHVCVKHERRFSSKCQYCHIKLPWLARSVRPGHCSKCGEWLGTGPDEPSMDAEVSLPELEWQSFVTKNLEEMISSGTYHPQPPKEKIAKALSICISQAPDGVMNRFARLIDKRKTTVWGWQHGENQIPIDDLLRICYRVGASLVDFLYAEVFVLSQIESISVPVLFSGVKAIRRPARQLDRDATESALRRILKERTALSMRATADTLEINKRILYRHFPKLCKAISARHNQHLRACRDTRRHQYQTKINEAKDRLRLSGIYPSRRRVARVIQSRKLVQDRGTNDLQNCDMQIAAY